MYSFLQFGHFNQLENIGGKYCKWDKLKHINRHASFSEAIKNVLENCIEKDLITDR